MSKLFGQIGIATGVKCATLHARSKIRQKEENNPYLK